MAAEGIGVDGLHCISGTCDLCGEICDANTQELNVLSCTFKNCEDLPYHQDCLEKYLKSIRLERNRKTGFKCPRGCGKGTKHSGPCPGKIDKSHPIHPRNEEQKKKKKAAIPAIMAVAPVRVVKSKEEKKAEREKAKAEQAAAAAAAEKAKLAKAAAAAKPTPAAVLAAAAGKAKQQQQPDAKQLAAAAAQLKRELAANKTKAAEQAQQQHRDPSPSQPEYKTLDAYYRESNKAAATSVAAAAAAAPVVNAWAKPPAPASHALQGAQQQQRHRPAEPSRLPAASAAHDLSPAAALARTAAAAAAGRPAATAAGVGLPPLMPQPPPPPPPPPPLAAQQGGGLHHSPSIHSHPLAAQGSTASLVSQASAATAAAAGANGPALVGAEYVGEGEGHLTKAQRKNLKRAEKKKQKEGGAGAAAGQPGTSAAAAGAVSPAGGAPGGAKQLSRLSVVTGAYVGGSATTPGASSSMSLSRRASSASEGLTPAGAAGPSSTPGAAAAAAAAAAARADGEDADSTAVMYELAVHALLAQKTLALVASLQRLGFSEWRAAAAVQRHGSDLEAAVAWLLEGGAPDPEAAAAVSAGCVADVSIVEELRLMKALGSALSYLTRAQLYGAVTNAGGDLDKAAAAAMAQNAEAEADAEAAAAAAAAEATPAGSSNSPLASQLSVTASPTSTTSAQQQQQAHKDQLQQQQQQMQQQQQQQQPQQQLANGLASVDSGQYSAFGSNLLGLYGTPAAPDALAPAARAAALGPATDTAPQPVSDGFPSWLNPAGSSGLGGGLSAHPLHSLTSSNLEASGSGFGGFVPGSATAAASMGSNIWGAGGGDAASAAAGWGQLSAVGSVQLAQQPGELVAGAGSSSLFADGGYSNQPTLAHWGAAGLAGQSGLGLLGTQGSLSAAQPALNPYAPFGGGAGGSLFAPGPLAAQPMQQPAVSTPAAGDAGLQQSRLFSSYGVSQPSLFGTSGLQPQQQQQGGGWIPGAAAGTIPETAASADDDDLEGLLATLMCH